MKRKYQGVIVLDVSGKEDSVEDLIGQVGSEIESEGGRLEQIDQLGKKDFAYNPRHLSSGFYVNYMFEAEPDKIEKLRARLQLNDLVYLQHYQLA
jgi:small subunit ribosomal protein S6